MARTAQGVRSGGKRAAGLACHRRARMPALIGGPADLHERLDRFAALCVGVGSIGGRVAVELARLQIGRLLLADPACFKPESVLTHAGVTPDDAGRPKATWTAERCRQISPTTRVEAHVGPAEQIDLAIVADFDLVILATDNILIEVLAGETTHRLRRPMMQAAVHGESLVAQVRFYRNESADGPCAACSLTSAEWDHLNAHTRFSCERIPAGQPAALHADMATSSIGALCSVSADLAVLTILRAALGLGQPLTDCEQEYCGFTGRTTLSPMKRNANCPADHAPWTVAAHSRPLRECTLGELASACGVSGLDGDADVAFRVGDLAFGVARCGCDKSAGDTPRGRFLDSAADRRCRVCGQRPSAGPVDAVNPVPLNKVAGVLDRPLSRLGAGAARWVMVRSGERHVMLTDPGSAKKEDLR